MSNPERSFHRSPGVPARVVAEVAPAEPVGGWLVYRAHPNGGAVFAYAGNAIRADAIHGALNGSTTWGEFRSRLPRDEWESLEANLNEHYGYVDAGKDEGDDGDPDRPKWDDFRAPFSPEMIPGFSDGDYPPWLQSLDDILPADVLARFAERRSSIINGSFWFIPAERAGEVAEALRQPGYQVEEADFLGFF